MVIMKRLMKNRSGVMSYRIILELYDHHTMTTLKLLYYIIVNI